jgi:hypothetical protein
MGARVCEELSYDDMHDFQMKLATGWGCSLEGNACPATRGARHIKRESMCMHEEVLEEHGNKRFPSPCPAENVAMQAFVSVHGRRADTEAPLSPPRRLVFSHCHH